MNARRREEPPISGGRDAAEKAVITLIALSRSDEACRLLGVDGVLMDQLDITFLEDPADYLAYDIATALREAEEEMVPAQNTMLSTLVAELRLSSLLGMQIAQHELTERVIRHLEQMQA